MLRPSFLLPLLACGFLVPWPIQADDPPARRRQADQEALKPYGSLVGDWKGWSFLFRPGIA